MDKEDSSLTGKLNYFFSKERLFYIYPAVLGFVSFASQLILLRLFFSVFSGIELSSGFFLSCWLLWTGVGGLAASLVLKQVKDKEGKAVFIQNFIPWVLIISYIQIIFFRRIFSSTLGEIVSAVNILLCAFSSLFLLCILFGYCFGLSCFIYPRHTKHKKIGFSYALESMGAFLGAVLFGNVLILFFGHFTLIVILLLINSLYCFVLSLKLRKILLARLTAFIALISILVLFSGLSYRLNLHLFGSLFEGQTLLEVKDSPYSNIQVLQSKGEISFFEDAALSFTVPDRRKAENTVHLTMLQHPHPRQVLLISTDGGQILQEILKYPQVQVQCMEQDKTKIELIQKYVPKEYSLFYSHPGVSLFKGDIASFLLDKRGVSYDCIMLNISAPVNLSLNRFYTVEFFSRIKEHLRKPGIISFSLPFSDVYLSREARNYVMLMKNTLEHVFEDVAVYPGDSISFFASNTRGVLTSDYRKIEEERLKRRIDTRFIRQSFLFDRLSSFRLDSLHGILEGVELKSVNRDFHPLCFWAEIVFWTRQFKDVFGRILKLATFKNILLLLGLFMLVLFVTGLRSRADRVIFISLGTTGLSEIAFQIITVLGFQIIYGSVYYMLGLIFGSFMLGLFAGSLYTTRKIDSFRSLPKRYACIQALIFVYPLLLICGFMFFKRTSSLSEVYLGKAILAFAFPMVAGFAGGVQYVLANTMLSGNRTEAIGPMTYAFDLFGSSLGSLAVVLFVIPVLGVIQTLVFVACLNLLIFILLLIKLFCRSSANI